MYTEDVNATDSECLRLEILRKIEETESIQYECKDVLQKLDAWEDESYSRINRSKALNDQFLNMNKNSGDSKLYSLLI